MISAGCLLSEELSSAKKVHVDNHKVFLELTQSDEGSLPGSFLAVAMMRCGSGPSKLLYSRKAVELEPILW